MNIKEKIEQLHTNKEFDVFYPKDYTVAVFPNTVTMGAAQKALLRAGWTANNIMALPALTGNLSFRTQ